MRNPIPVATISPAALVSPSTSQVRKRRWASPRTRTMAMRSVAVKLWYYREFSSFSSFELFQKRFERTISFKGVSSTVLPYANGNRFSFLITSIRHFGINSARVKEELRRRAEQRRRDKPLSNRARKEQARLLSFSYKRNPNKKKYKGPFDPSVVNIVKMHLCRDETDLHFEPYDLPVKTSKFDVEHIKRHIEKVFDNSDELEFYEDEMWKPLRSLIDILEYRGGTVPVKIRVPAFYDATPLPDASKEELVGEDEKGDEVDESEDEEGENGGKVLNAFQLVIPVLKSAGYRKSEFKRDTLLHGEREIRTADWLLQRAEEDRKLESVLLNEVGALRHVVEFLNYDFVWKRYG